MKKKFILVSSLFFSMSINEVFSGNLCYPTNSFYNSSSINPQSMCIVPQNTSVYNEESEFEIPTISTKGLEWKTPNVSELRNRTRICNIIEKKDDNISVTICYPNQTVTETFKTIKWEAPSVSELKNQTRTCKIIEKKDSCVSVTICYPNQAVERIFDAIKGAIIELPQDFINNYLPTIIEKVNDFKSTMVKQMQILYKKTNSYVASIPSKLSQGTSYCVSKVKDFAVSIYQNMRSFITNSVTSLRQKIN